MNIHEVKEKFTLQFFVYLDIYTNLCGISKPPSAAPFMAPNARFPVVVLIKPTSR